MGIVRVFRAKVKGTEDSRLGRAFPSLNPDDIATKLDQPGEKLANAKIDCQASVPRDVFPPTPPGPEGSNGNGLLRVQWVAGAWLI